MPRKIHEGSQEGSSKSKKMALSSQKPNTIQVGSGSKINTVEIKGENGYVTDFDSIQPGIKPELMKPEAFKGTPMTQSDFNILDYMVYCHPNTAAAHLSKTKEYKEELKKKPILLQVSKDNKLMICSNLHASTLKNIVSFNKACAIMSLSIVKHYFKVKYDWDSWQYKAIEVSSKAEVDLGIINRLASSMGMSSDDMYYWFVVPGFEFLYDVYPCEVIALVLARVNYRSQMNIPDDMSDEDLVNSLTMKMNRRHNLSINSIFTIFEKLGFDKIKSEYDVITENIGKSGRAVRNEEMVEALKDLTEKISSVVLNRKGKLIE